MTVRAIVPTGAVLLIFAGAGFMAGCGEEPLPAATPPASEVSGVQTFETCEELETWIEDAMVSAQRDYLSAAVADAEVMPTPPMLGAEAQRRTGFAALDTRGPQRAIEIGDHVYSLNGRQLRVMRISADGYIAVVYSRPVPGEPIGLLGDADATKVVVLSRERGNGGGWNCFDDRCAAHRIATRASVFDVRFADTPTHLGDVWIPGHLRSADLYEGALRVAQSDGFAWPPYVRWTAPLPTPGFTPADEELKWSLENQRHIRSRTLRDWLAPVQFEIAGVVRAKPLACAGFARSLDPVRAGLTRVAIVPLDAPEMMSVRAFTFAVDQVRFTDNSVYLAAVEPADPDQDVRARTRLYALPSAGLGFDLRGTGSIEGRILDPSAFDVRHGQIRLGLNIEDVRADRTINRAYRIAVFSDAPQYRLRGTVIREGMVRAIRFDARRAFVLPMSLNAPVEVIGLHTSGWLMPGETVQPPGDVVRLLAVEPEQLLVASLAPQGSDMRSTLFGTLYQLRGPSIVELDSVAMASSNAWHEPTFDPSRIARIPGTRQLTAPYANWTPGEHGVRLWRDFDSGVSFTSLSGDKLERCGEATIGGLYEDAGDSTFSAMFSDDWSPWTRAVFLRGDYGYVVADAGVQVVDVGEPSTEVRRLPFDQAPDLLPMPHMPASTPRN